MTKAFKINTNTSFNLDFNANGTSYRIEVVFNTCSDSYFFNLYRLQNLKLLLAGITLSTGTNLLSQFPTWFKLFIVPTRPELYSVNPTSKNIKDFLIWVEDEE